MFAGQAPATSLAWLDFGGEIRGEEAADRDHLDWIVITGFDFAGQRGTQGPLSFGLSKNIDRATPKLFINCAEGTHFPKARLDLVDPSTTTPTNICRLELEDVVVTSLTTSGVTTGKPDEKIQLAFRKITYSYFPTGIKEQEPYYSLYDYVTLEGSSGTGVPPTSENPDTDNDGLPDAWEKNHGLQVGTNDAAADLDGDGFSNLEEYKLGTDPGSGASFLKVTVTVDPNSQTGVSIRWNAVPGRTYLLEWTPNLSSPFATLRTVTPESEQGSVSLPQNGSAMGFYRVRLQP